MKIISLSLYLALRFHQESKKNKMITFMSILSIIGTSLGISMLIISFSAINGFNKELNDRILSIIPHGEIESINLTNINNGLKIIHQIQKIPGIVQATPYIYFSGLIDKKNKFYPIQIHGISTLYDVHPQIINYLSSTNTPIHFSPNKHFVILGKGVADNLKIQKNEWINILIHSKDSKNHFTPYKQIHLQVIDILNIKSYLDHNLILIPLLDAQKYLHQINNISGIRIKVNNIFHITKILNQIKQTINDNVIIRSWIDTYNYIYQDIQMIQKIIYLTITLVIIIACFSMVSVLILTIKEKKYDIAILRTLGANKKLIYTIFIWYSCLNNLISLLIGGIFGVFMSLNLTKIYNILEHIFMPNLLNNNTYFINFLPSELYIQDVIFVITLEILLSLLVTLYPIIQINHIAPSKILK